jgi:hypothetical protein
VKATLHTDGGAYHFLGLAVIGSSSRTKMARSSPGSYIRFLRTQVGSPITSLQYKALIAGLELALGHGVTTLRSSSTRRWSMGICVVTTNTSDPDVLHPAPAPGPGCNEVSGDNFTVKPQTRRLRFRRRWDRVREPRSGIPDCP